MLKERGASDPPTEGLFYWHLEVAEETQVAITEGGVQ
jgi:hypothetical protein